MFVEGFCKDPSGLRELVVKAVWDHKCLLSLQGVSEGLGLDFRVVWGLV